MTADIKKNKVKRTLSILCSSSNFLSLQERLMLLASLLLKLLRKGFMKLEYLFQNLNPQGLGAS
jgi:hypothetical protein